MDSVYDEQQPFKAPCLQKVPQNNHRRTTPWFPKCLLFEPPSDTLPAGWRSSFPPDFISSCLNSSFRKLVGQIKTGGDLPVLEGTVQRRGQEPTWLGEGAHPVEQWRQADSTADGNQEVAAATRCWRPCEVRRPPDSEPLQGWLGVGSMQEGLVQK